MGDVMIGKKTISIVMFGTLAACGGPSGGSNAFQDIFESASSPFLDGALTLGSARVPTEDSATFNGAIAIAKTSDISISASDIIDNGDIFGAMELVADFDTDTITGSATDFIDKEGTDLAGTMTLSNGVIQRGPTVGVGAMVAGTAGDFDLDGSLLGFFENDGAQIVGRVVDGTIGTDGTFQGVFYVAD